MTSLWTAVALAAIGCLLGGCQRSRPVEARFTSDSCAALSGAHEATMRFSTPEPGALVILIRERGVSAIARLDDKPATDSATPIERLGTMVLMTPSRAGQTHSVQVRSADSPGIVGQVCLSALSLPLAEDPAEGPWSSLAAAGRATHSEDWQAAYEAFLNAARRSDQKRQPFDAAAARHAMAELAYLRLDRKRDSYALASDALAYYRGAGRGGADSELRAGLLNGLQAKALLDMPGGDLRSDLPRVRSLLSEARRKVGFHAYAARELPRLDIMAGFLEYRLDAPERARSVFGQAARRCRELRDWDCYAIASQNLALLAAESRDFAIALAAFADALRWLPPDLDPKLSADIWNNYGALQGIVGLLSSSERSHAHALREYARLGDCQGVRRTLSRAGNLLVQIGSLSDAKSMLRRAASLDCASLLSSAAIEGAAATGAADAAPDGRDLQRLGRSAGVDWCAGPLETSGLATDNRLIVFNSLLWLNDALTLSGESTAARKCLDAADRYAVTARTRMRLFTARGEAALAGNDPRAARTDFQHALAIADEAQIPQGHEYRGYARIGIVRSHLLAGDSAATVREASATLRASIGRADLSQTVSSLRLLAAGLRGSRQPGQAAHVLQTAADLIEAVPIDELDGEKRAIYLATQYGVYSELTDLYASQAAGDGSMISLAFSTSERGRARSLRYAVAQTATDASPAPEPPAARYQQLLREVVQLGAPAADATPGALIDSLDAAARGQRAAEEPLDTGRLALVLGKLDATLVEYAVGTHDLFAFSVDRASIRMARLGSWDEIGSMADALRELLRDPEAPAREVTDAARRLAARVLWPLTGQMRNKRIIFVPDGALHTVPFGVLPWSQDSAQLLLQHAEISVAPSARFLTAAASADPGRPQRARIELLGDPVFRIADWRRECPDGDSGAADALPSRLTGWTESLPRLPGSRTEVQLIAHQAQRLRPGDSVQILTGCDARPSALQRAASAPLALLHIATHARVDAQRPRLSALALTPEWDGGSISSTLGLLQILELRLRSGMVVLSACETSRGRLLPGEGLLGPAQAFLQAGASAVIATGWRIDDRTTLNFMENFYRHLLLDRLPAGASLRKAQLEALDTTAPHDWAAFTLYGWPDERI